MPIHVNVHSINGTNEHPLYSRQRSIGRQLVPSMLQKNESTERQRQREGDRGRERQREGERGKPNTVSKKTDRGALDRHYASQCIRIRVCTPIYIKVCTEDIQMRTDTEREGGGRREARQQKIRTKRTCILPAASHPSTIHHMCPHSTSKMKKDSSTSLQYVCIVCA